MPSPDLIFVLRGSHELLSSSENDAYIDDELSLEDDDEDSQFVGSPISDNGTPPPNRTVLLSRYVTTDHTPKNPDKGFVFGRDPEKCDIVLNSESVGEVQFALRLNLKSGFYFLKNLSVHGTKVSFEENWATKIKGTHALVHNSAADIDLGNDHHIYVESYKLTDAKLQMYRAQSQNNPTLGFGLLGLGTNIETKIASARRPVYIQSDRLGGGEFTEVFLAAERHSADAYAMKVYKPGREYLSELAILKRLEHVNVVRYHRCLEVAGQGAQLIMEYAAGHKLEQLFSPSSKHPPLATFEIREVLYQLLDAVKHIHDKGVTHRDINPENIILTQRSPVHVKLIGFGLATKDDYFGSYRGTPLYLAPELILKSGPYTNKVDIFAIGVILLELFGIKFDNVQESHEETCLEAVQQQRKALAVKHKPLPYNFELGILMLEDRPDDRPSAQKCLKHPFFDVDPASGRKRRRVLNEEGTGDNTALPLPDSVPPPAIAAPLGALPNSNDQNNDMAYAANAAMFIDGLSYGNHEHSVPPLVLSSGTAVPFDPLQNSNGPETILDRGEDMALEGLSIDASLPGAELFDNNGMDIMGVHLDNALWAAAFSSHFPELHGSGVVADQMVAEATHAQEPTMTSAGEQTLGAEQLLPANGDVARVEELPEEEPQADYGRRHTKFSDQDLRVLNEEYQNERQPSADGYDRIASRVSLSHVQVRDWFRRRRTKEKKTAGYETSTTAQAIQT